MYPSCMHSVPLDDMNDEQSRKILIVKSVIFIKKNQASAAKDSISLSFTQYYLFVSENVEEKKLIKRARILLQYVFNTKRTSVIKI